MCRAQNDAVEEIVVTGLMEDDSYEQMPSVTLKKPADFLVQRVKVINDSRSKDLRNDEIRQTLQALIDSGKSRNGIQISYGSSFLQPLDAKDKSLTFGEQKGKDTSYFNISIKQKYNEKVPAKQQTDELLAFIKRAKKAGRTELEVDDEIAMSIVNPEKFRPEILQKIAKENSSIKSAVGSDCTISLDGLSNRVKWERNSISELTVYIPYKTTANCK